jgi:hydrogenase maturation protein HypF
MAFDLNAVTNHCQFNEAERDMLLSRQRPIVLLERLPDSSVAVQEVAPNLHNLGVMLAYTPLHLLLLETEPGYPDIWVMTSGNLSEEPVSYDDEEALARLEHVADGFLVHNRPIHTRVDDSVLTAFQGHPYLVRRARGYAPDPVQLPRELPPILAVGPELKNTYCLVRERYAFLSHHIGDMENLETLRSFEEGIAHFERLFRIRPELIACDLHPNYMATRYAEQRAKVSNLPLVAVQHHHAHLAACLADNAWDSAEPVIGLSFDGTGLGTDGAIWGSEVMLGGYSSYQRSYHLAYVPLPGGDLAVRKPSRMALAHLWRAGLEWDPDLPSTVALCADERTVLRSQLEHNINCPLTSSMGRLFDAASALIGVRQTATYEGQAAIELEACADLQENGAYDFGIEGDILDPAPMWRAMLADWQAGVSIPVMSARFHNGLAVLAGQICERLRESAGVDVVALSGGVWQNRLLLEKTLSNLTQNRFHVLYHHQVPTNDGGVAIGQAMVAAYQMNGWK